jgi:Holliday junction resolvase RusA-like endonuclease
MESKSVVSRGTSKSKEEDLNYFLLDLPQSMISKSNFRRGNSSIQWKKYAKFEKDLALEISIKLPKKWDLGSRELSVEKRPKIISVIYAVSLTDTSNYSKSILDACEGVVYHNDASVAYTSAIGKRGRVGERIIVAFAQVPAGTGVDEIVGKAKELELKVLEII